MSSLKLAFPPSRTCLWDSTPSGETTELSMTKDGWLLVQVSSSCLQVALNYAKSHSSKTIDCFLIATSWINEAENITVEVDRFDPGRLNKERTAATPTSLISGDIVVKTQIVLGSHPDSKYLTHNLTTLGDTLDEMTKSLSLHRTTTLDPTSLLSLRIHCACTHEGAATLRCGCVMPAQVYQATPISSIPIASTALARNLSGPLPLSALQGRTKHGYVTMESSRKIVLLLHSDPIVSSIPLVGVWVSGVGSVHHPLVWAACMAYTHSTALRDRVWGSEGEGEKEGGTFLTLVYLEGCTQPSFWECQFKGKTPEGANLPPFKISTGEAEIQVPTEHSLVGLALAPAGESTAMHTLLETTLASSSSSSPRADPRAPASLTAPSTATHTHTTSPPTAVATSTPCSQAVTMTVSSSALPPDADSGEESVLAVSPLPSCLPTPSQAPERIVRDKNLSMISSLSQPDSPREAVTSRGREEGNELASQSSTGVDGTAGINHHQQQTTPASHMTSPSIHMALEDHQNQLKTLADQVRCIFESQSSGSVPSPVATRGTPTSADAATSTGASLWSPSLPPGPSQSGGLSSKAARVVEKDSRPTRDGKESGGVVVEGSFSGPLRPTAGSGGLDRNIEDAAVLDTFSMRTATTSMCSQDTANGHVHVDLHSYVGESYVSEGLGESASVSLPYGLEQQESAQLSPLTLHDYSADAVNGEMLAGVEERLKALLKMQAKRECSVPKGSASPQDSVRSSGCSSSQGLVCGGKKKRGKKCGGLVVESGHSSRGEFADTSMSSYSSHQSCAAAANVGSGSLSLSPQQRWRDEGKSAGSGGEDDSSDKTPTPPHHSDDSSSTKVVTPPSTMPPPPIPSMTTPHPHVAPPPFNIPTPHHHQHYNQHYPQPPFATPLSTRTGHHLLHPDVLLQQHFHPDISMLPVPHILCPSGGSSHDGGGGGGDGMSFAAVLGNDYTLDENVHMADIIALKYLDMPTTSTSSRSPSAKTAESRHRNGGKFFADDVSTDTTLNMSMATQQYLQRYNLLGPGCAKRVGVCSPVLEGQQEENASPPPLNPTLDLQALKTLRNKLAHLSDSGTK